MAILGSIVAHQHSPRTTSSHQPDSFGFRALKPAIAIYPQFLEKLVSRLSSADHTLCANALQLINALMRDAITNDGEAEWPKFIKKLQELGVIKVVYTLMQSTALQDLAHPLLEFQALTKVLLRKWRDIVVDLRKPEHRRALKGIHIASNPEKASDSLEDGEDRKEKKHNPEKWRRLGFETENPSWEFEETGYLGMMDLTDYVRKHEDAFPKLILEQSTLLPKMRCPIARASLAVTTILYDLFEVDKSDLDDAKSYLVLETRSSYDKIFKPLILQWSRLHLAGLQAFLRLWKATGAEREDFLKLVGLVRILLEAVVGGAKREKSVGEVEDEMQEYDSERLRQMQMELFELTYEDTWGHHLRQVRDELNHEALQFMKEQRIRCLLQGAWFPNHKADADLKPASTSSFRYAKLSHNRRFLHYADFDIKGDQDPDLDSLREKRMVSLKPPYCAGHRHWLTSISSSRPLPRLLRRLQYLYHNAPLNAFLLLHPQKHTPSDHNIHNHHPRLPPLLFLTQAQPQSLQINLPFPPLLIQLPLPPQRDSASCPPSSHPLPSFRMARRIAHAVGTTTADK